MAKPFFEFVHPDDLKRTHAENDFNVAGSEILNFENRYIAKDGSIVWLSWTGSINKKTNLIYAVAHDITDRKESELEIQELSNALQNAVEGIAKIDQSGEITAVNKSFAQQLDYALDELIGVHWQNIVAPSSLQSLEAAFAVMNRAGKCTFEAHGLRKNGKTFSNELTIIKAVDAQGEFAGHHCFMKDITERKQAQLNLQESEARFSNLAKHLPGIVYQFLLRNNKAFHFPYISESCKSITGYEPFEIQQRPSLIFRMIYREDLPFVKRMIYHSARTGTMGQFEGRLITKSGQTRWIQASSTPEVLDTGDVLWSCLLMDISDLKIAQDKIKELNEDLEQRLKVLGATNSELETLTRKLETAYDEALEASRLKSEFVANISHEVRTPISAVIGMSDLLLDTELNSEQKEFARIVRESADSLLTIINDILDFSKMEADKVELETIGFDVGTMVESCAELLASNARDKGLALVTYVDPQIPKVLVGDPMRLRQIVLNLTSNAVKFTEHGEVIIKADLIEIREDEAAVKFSVKDTGIGMTAEAKKLLFRPFVQADGSTTRKYGGTGLGLSISKRLAEMMNATIAVDSAPGEGSTFSLEGVFPFLELDTRTILDELPTTELASKRALIATNNNSTSHSVEKYLQAAKIKTLVCGDAESAINQLNMSAYTSEDTNGGGFDFVVCDFVGDQSQDSFSILRAIQDNELLHAIKPIQLAGFDQKDKVDVAIKQGFSACLTKPVRQSQIYSLIRRLISESYAPPATSSPLILDAASTVKTYTTSNDENPTQAQHKRNAQAIVLLAEDNPVIQNMALRQLKKLGYPADVVSNGKEVLAAVKLKQYSIILMDCQMPDVDGFEATKTIRSMEFGTDKHVPIVALTASAMQGDRESCIEAGMDDYLSKPVDQHKLLKILQAWCPTYGATVVKEKDLTSLNSLKNAAFENNQTTQDEKSVPAATSPKTHFDFSRLQEVYGNEGMHELLQSFLEEAVTLMQSIETARLNLDDREFLSQVHQLKGLAAVMTLEELEKICRKLEQEARRVAWDEIEQSAKELRLNYDVVKKLIINVLA